MELRGPLGGICETGGKINGFHIGSWVGRRHNFWLRKQLPSGIHL